MKISFPHLCVAGMMAAVGLAIAAFSSQSDAAACRLPYQPNAAYTMEVLVDGRPLQEYLANGTTYVEALKGRDYEIRLTNRTGERVAVALAVDGLNSIDAKHTSTREARKWILAPWESTTLSGWQTGSGTARRFVFTSEQKSYGAWLGRTSDLGVISAAFFREARRAQSNVAPPPFDRPDAERMKSTAPEAPPAARERDLKAQAEAGAGSDDSTVLSLSGKAAAPKAKDELAATGIGREIDHQIYQVQFDEEDAPSSTVNVRYEFHDALVRLGVLPKSDDALARREHARGFADSGFAPDPYRGR